MSVTFLKTSIKEVKKKKKEITTLKKKLLDTELALNATKSENNRLKERIAQAELALVDLYESSLNPEVVSSVDDNGK